MGTCAGSEKKKEKSEKKSCTAVFPFLWPGFNLSDVCFFFYTSCILKGQRRVSSARTQEKEVEHGPQICVQHDLRVFDALCACSSFFFLVPRLCTAGQPQLASTPRAWKCCGSPHCWAKKKRGGFEAAQVGCMRRQAPLFLPSRALNGCTLVGPHVTLPRSRRTHVRSSSLAFSARCIACHGFA